MRPGWVFLFTSGEKHGIYILVTHLNNEVCESYEKNNKQIEHTKND